jgi:hypothetical protein
MKTKSQLSKSSKFQRGFQNMFLIKKTLLSTKWMWNYGRFNSTKYLLMLAPQWPKAVENCPNKASCPAKELLSCKLLETPAAVAAGIQNTEIAPGG